MADTKISELSADTAPSTDDLVVTVNDPGGSPANRKVTLANLTKGLSPTALTDKAAPVGADELIIADSEASNVIKKADATSVVNAALSPTDLTDKATPVAADEVPIADSEASGVIKKADIQSIVAASSALIPDAAPTTSDKATPVAADEIVILDSEASSVLKTADAQSIVAATTALLQGKQTIWIPANAMTPATTSGPATGQIESVGSPTNGLNVETLDFDGASDEAAHFSIAFPKAWNADTVTFQVFWTTTATGSPTALVAWALQALGMADSGSLDGAYGTAVIVNDESSLAYHVGVSPESSAITIGGDVADNTLVNFRFFRDVSDSGDTMGEDAILLGIKLFYTVSAANDA